VRLLVAAEQMLDTGARRGETHPQLDRPARDESDAFEQGGMALGELPGGDERPCPGKEEVDTLVDRCGLGKDPQRLSEPDGGTGGCTLCGPSPAARSVATAAASPRRAQRWTWWARSDADAPRAASIAAQRSWAPSRQPPDADS
jgi:hypothetical protein